MNALVGYTGFVGSNLYAKGHFERVYNSRNIADAYGTRPDMLVYAGVRAEKYLANNNPAEDLERIKDAEGNIAKILPKKLILISTIDVFKKPLGVDENSVIETDGLQAYGYNRYMLECWAREHYPDALIIRLPALFGRNIKKNFIYDFMNLIPFMLKDEKFHELAGKEPALKAFYEPQPGGFYRLAASDEDRVRLKSIFSTLGFSALHFTDSRSKYQFYNLEHLWDDIGRALHAGITLWHPATEPISAGELYHYLTGGEFINELDGMPAEYDYRTVYGSIFHGVGDYIDTASHVMEQIKSFIERNHSNAAEKHFSKTI